ncbi:MAG: HAD family phosphatase [Verrucomicrobia bacterium]|nr:HAD family phosphatase [Verrucomicrobiota bacterium]
MSVPKAIIFDLGKVLLDFDYGIALRRLLPRCRVGFDDLRRWLTLEPLLLEYESGQRTTAGFFEQLQAVTGYDGTLAEFRSVFGDIFTPIEPMVALHAELRARGLPTYLFSNTNEMAVEFVRARFPFFATFDGYVLSYEVRSMKPAPPMYEVAERLSGWRGADLFYLDDRPENLEAGWRRGWRGVVHEDPALSRAALQQVGAI